MMKELRRPLLFLALLAISAIAIPLLSPHDFQVPDWDALYQPPSASHWLGTDPLGRDLLARVAFGTGISLLIGIAATAVSLLIGVTWGAVAGYAGGRIDQIMMRGVDILYAVPFMFFVILMTAFFGRSIFLIFIAIGAVEWLTMARIVRGQTLSLRHRGFVEAAEVAGVPAGAIIRRHILPNALGPVIAYATLTIPQVILAESFLSFLGLGVQEPLTSLGLLIKEGAENMETARWLLIAPGCALAFLLLALNALGEALNRRNR